jgi:hypothetical protein
MVDVVDVLDAFEAKRKHQPKIIFNVEPWRIGNGFYVTATMPDSEPRRVTETFKTEGEAWRWIRNESAAWLLMRTTLSVFSGLLVGLIVAAIIFVGGMWLVAVGMGTGINLLSLFGAAFVVLEGALSIGVAAGIFTGAWTFASFNYPRHNSN